MLHRLATFAILSACPLAAAFPAQPFQSPDAAPLSRVAAVASAVEEGARSILNREGREVAVISSGTDNRSLRVRRHGNAQAFDAPAFQRWLASEDGRTLVGVGDPEAPEHPFELRFSIYTDGSLLYESQERLDPESTFAVGEGGKVAFVGHPVGEREQWFAALFEPAGSSYEQVFRHDLPKGLQAQDPAIFSKSLLLLAYEPYVTGSLSARAGEILIFDAAGSRNLITVPRAQQLIAFPRFEGAVIRSNERLTWISVPTGRVVWRSETALRPAGPHAWTVWSPASATAALVVAASDARRRGEPAPPVVLRLFDLHTGAALSSVSLERHGPLAHLRVASEKQHLIIDWMDVREVFEWQR